MTFKKICNRCEKDISEGIQDDDNELHFTKKRNTIWGYDECIHLCTACLQVFDDFMNNKLKFYEDHDKK